MMALQLHMFTVTELTTSTDYWYKVQLVAMTPCFSDHSTPGVKTCSDDQTKHTMQCKG